MRLEEPATLVGGAAVEDGMLAMARALAPRLVAADRAADHLAARGAMPEAVVGDMDSIRDLEAWRRGPARVVHLPEQETTDFEKCLYATDAPFYLALGFVGRRLDHTLAVLHALLSRPEKRVVLIGEREAIALVPPGRGLALDLAAGAKVSLFPLREVVGTRSVGLTWSVAGLRMAPGRTIGTSNVASAARVEVGVDRAGCVVMVPLTHARAMIRAVTGV